MYVYGSHDQYNGHVFCLGDYVLDKVSIVSVAVCDTPAGTYEFYGGVIVSNCDLHIASYKPAEKQWLMEQTIMEVLLKSMTSGTFSNIGISMEHGTADRAAQWSISTVSDI